MFNKDDFLSKITEIGTCEDIVEVRTMLTELSDNVSEIYDHNSELSESVSKLTTDNETLRSANMELFLKVGSKHKPDSQPSEPTERRSFKNLFDEKGAIK